VSRRAGEKSGGLRVFQINVETCPSCGGTVKVIASIEDPPLVERVLSHLAGKDSPGLRPDSRAPLEIRKWGAYTSCTPESVDPESLADFINVTFEAAFILSKTFLDADIIAGQLGHYRRY